MTLTFADLVDHVLAFGGTDASRESSSRHRMAVQNAYRVLPTRHHWSYLWSVGRVNTHASYATGTVAFDLTGGLYERMFTLTGGVWPSWAALGYVVINNRLYEVEDRKSDTVITVGVATAPADDIAAGTAYYLVQDRYAVPSDFVGVDEVTVNEVGAVLEYVHPRNWASERRTNTGPGQPWAYTILGSQDSVGANLMAFWPPPDNNYAVDFLYRRKPRPIVYETVTDGTVSVANGDTAVTGVGTLFKAAHVGSIIRFGDDNQTAPTGDGGLTPASFEARVTAVASATALTIDAAAPQAYDSVRYAVTDPIDIDPTTMGEYLLREVEKQWRAICREKPLPDEMGNYQLALTQAMEADNRSSSRTAALRKQTRRSGFIHYPIQFTGG